MRTVGKHLQWGITLTVFLLGITGLEAVATAEIAAADTTPPQLVSLDFTPKTIDVSAGPQTVTFTVGATDDVTGVDGVIVVVTSPSGNQTRYFETFGQDAEPTTGTRTSGTWVRTITFPQASESGTWIVERVTLFDTVGNRRDILTTELSAQGFPTELIILPNSGASPIPSPPPTSPTQAVTHDRSVSIQLRRHLVVRGKVEVVDGFDACSIDVLVRVQRRRANGHWRTLDKVTTDSTGSYNTRIGSDRQGVYRTKLRAISLSSTDTCSAAKSITRRHDH